MSSQLHLKLLKTRKKIFLLIKTGDTLRIGKISKIWKSYSSLMVIIPDHFPFQVPKHRGSWTHDIPISSQA